MERHIGVVSATALVVGEVIGVGIFLTPAQMIKSLGSPLLVMIVWLVMGLMAVCGALCYGGLAARFPEAGGGYVYLREAYGEQVAFLYGWKCFLVMDPGLTAALAVGMATYVGYLIPIPASVMKCIAVIAILALGALNIAGLKAGVSLVRWLTLLKLVLLAAIIALAFAAGSGQWPNFWSFTSEKSESSLVPGLMAGMMAAFFSFGGWWDLSKLGEEVREPQRTLPRAFLAGVLLVTLVYIVTSMAFVYLVPPDRVVSDHAFAAQVGQVLFGRVGARVFSFVVIISVLGSLAGLMMAAPRVYYAMSRDGLFFSSVASLHAKFGTPARAISLQAVLACLLVVLGTFNQIIAYFIFVTVAFLALTVVAVFVLRRKSAGPGALKIPGYPVTPICFLAVVAVLLSLIAARSPLQALLGTMVVLAGAPVYGLFFRKRGGKPESKLVNL